MSVKHEAAGRRSVQVDVVVTGTPAEVWQAIATGPGVSSWFVPTEFDESDGRPIAIRADFGPGMAVRSPVTHWDPPHAYTAQGDGWGGSPPIATEWSVEPLSDGQCLVRVVNSLVADSADWDAHLEATESGWPGFFRILQIYLTHFRGQPAVLTQLMATVDATASEAWDDAIEAFGLNDASVGKRCTAPIGMPALAGVVAYVSRDPNDVLMRLETPGPGIAALGSFSHGGVTMLALNLYLYGDRAIGISAIEAPLWRAWMARRFPEPTPAIDESL